ncbi:MAG: DUF695 domain-containing protein [Planctomycetaceae bacterium]|nr:MAG: DUF695 domain-containing protein [Planctomycetaceae bacterium]
MAEDWDFYVAPVDDHLASIFVDLSLVESAPEATRTRLLRVAVPLKAPRDDGLSDDDETDALYEVEDALFASVARGLGARYVGRVTNQGRREFFYYASSAEGLDAALQLVRPRFPAYEFTWQDQDDRDWSLYLDLLYPSDLDLQTIQNRRVVETLAESGDDLTEPRNVDHWAYFPSEHAREQFVSQLDGQGFTVKLSEVEEPDAEFRYGVHLIRRDRVDLDTIDALAIDLYLRASTCGGEYDGWEAPAVASGG